MNDGDALFRVVCEQPWEDTPRLAYADWLEETGIYNGHENVSEAQLRAQFIRHQIRMTRGDLAARSAHPQLMFTSFCGCVERWGRELPNVPGVAWSTTFFHRGFVREATFTGAAPYPPIAAQLFAAAPVSRLVVRVASADALEAILDDDRLTRLESLDVCGPIGDAGATMIAASHNLLNLTELRIVNVGLTDVGITALTRAKSLTRLQSLRFDANRVTDRGVDALLHQNALPDLKIIGWAANPLGTKALLALRRKYRDTYV